MSYSAHQESAQPIIARCAIVTLSDTRTRETDRSGQLLRVLLERAGHSIVNYQLCRDEPAVLEPLLAALLARADVDVILTNGGTGISRRDQTIGVVEVHVDQPLPGFG